jgi:4-hydroxybenzoyl-CoA thioesterase
MARIKIDLPEKFVFSTEIPILINNINRGNHMSFDSILPMMEETRIRFMHSLGYANEKVNEAAFIVADVAVIYKRQGFHGQTMKIELVPADFASKGCDFLFRISDAASDEEVAWAKMGILFFDYARQKVVPVPEEFRKKFTEE